MILLHTDAPARARVRTTVGVPVGRRPRLSPEALLRVRLQLETGPHLAVFDDGLVAGAFTSAFDLGIGDVRDVAGRSDSTLLVQIRDDELIDAIDRDADLRRMVA